MSSKLPRHQYREIGWEEAHRLLKEGAVLCLGRATSRKIDLGMLREENEE